MKGVPLKHALSFLAAAALLFAPAEAAPDEHAFRLYAAGDYEAAAEKAASAGDAENLALAARALNAKAHLDGDDGEAKRAAKRAFDFAERALEADPDLTEGHLQAAISLAQRGARMAGWKAFFLGLASRAREHLDAALALEPDNTWALSSSGAWHLEVARRAGQGAYGADPESGYREFMAARAQAPMNLPIAYECALRLLAQDRAAWRADGIAALDAALELAPQNAFERSLQKKAQAFHAAIEKGRDAERAYIAAQP